MHKQESAEKRNIVYKKLNKYKKVDNINCPMGTINKLNIFKDYKFSFSFMNHFWKQVSDPTLKYWEHLNSEFAKRAGLIDEKIFDSYIANTVPLFYGNEDIDKYLNKNSFLNWHDFNDDEKFIDKIIELDNNDNLYLEYLNSNFFNDLKLINNLAEELKNVVEQWI